MRRHHYLYARNRYLTDPDVLAASRVSHRELAADQARELGLLDPDGPGFVDPSRSQSHAPRRRQGHHAAVQSQARRPHASTARTGETLARPLRTRRRDSTSKATANAAWGTKFVLVAARTDRRARPHHPRRRMGPHPRRRSPHRRRLLHPPRAPHPRRARRHLRHRTARRPPPDPPARPRPAPHQPRHRRQGQRQEAAPRRRATGREERPHRRQDHHPRRRHDSDTSRSTRRVARSASASSPTPATSHFTALPRVRTHRNRDKNGQYRWYNDYRLPDRLRAPDHHRPPPRQRRGRRAEAQPHRERPAHPARRSRLRAALPAPQRRRIHQPHLDDTLWLRRAHSIGHARQHLNLLGYALTVNALALHRHRGDTRRTARRLTSSTARQRLSARRKPLRARRDARASGAGDRPKAPESADSLERWTARREVFSHVAASPRPRSSGDRASVS